jgi:hypothetical protein
MQIRLTAVEKQYYVVLELSSADLDEIRRTRPFIHDEAELIQNIINGIVQITRE